MTGMTVAAGRRALAKRKPLQERGTQTVQALRDAAARLLGSRDFAHVTVADVARRAGVGVGTFYHFYPSKEALLLDLREQIFEETMASLGESFTTPVTDGTSLVAALEELCLRWIAVCRTRRGLERAIAALAFENEAFAAALRAQELRVQELVASLLRAYAPNLRRCDPDAAARAIVILFEAVVARSMREPDLAEQPGPVVHEVARMVARFLLPANPRA